MTKNWHEKIVLSLLPSKCVFVLGQRDERKKIPMETSSMTISEFKAMLDRLCAYVGYPEAFAINVSAPQICNSLAVDLWVRQLPETLDTQALRSQMKALNDTGSFALLKK